MGIGGGGLEKFFKFEQIEDSKRVNLACIKLKGRAFLW
jgi:hypothetical protein